MTHRTGAPPPGSGDVPLGGAGRRRALAFTLLAGLCVPAASILLHELGHFTAHAAFGYDTNSLTYASVRAGEPPPGVDPTLADGLSFAAGSTVSLALVGLAAWSVAALGPNPLALPVVMFECVRGLLGLGQRIGRSGPGETLAGGFGELRHAARALGGPGAAEIALSWIELGVPLLGLAFVLRRTRRGNRVRLTVVAFAGLVIGLALWMGLVGPRLLPA